MHCRFIFILAVSLLGFESCSGRFIRGEAKDRIREFQIVSVHANSWHGWGDPIPESRHLLFDVMSFCANELLSKKADAAGAAERYRSGRAAPGYEAARYAVQRLTENLSERHIRCSVMPSAGDGENSLSVSPIAFSSEIIRLILPALSEQYADPLVRCIPYITSGDPQSLSKPEDLPLLYIDKESIRGIEKISGRIKNGQSTGRVALSLTFHKQGTTIQGSGFGEMHCTAEALVFDEEGRTVWKTSAAGRGSSFITVMYFPLAWDDLVRSVREATKAAVDRLTLQMADDFGR